MMALRTVLACAYHEPEQPIFDRALPLLDQISNLSSVRTHTREGDAYICVRSKAVISSAQFSTLRGGWSTNAEDKE